MATLPDRIEAGCFAVSPKLEAFACVTGEGGTTTPHAYDVVFLGWDDVDAVPVLRSDDQVDVTIAPDKATRRTIQRLLKRGGFIAISHLPTAPRQGATAIVIQSTSKVSDTTETDEGSWETRTHKLVATCGRRPPKTILEEDVEGSTGLEYGYWEIPGRAGVVVASAAWAFEGSYGGSTTAIPVDPRALCAP